MTKSPEAFRTISEVADELGVPQHVLRFWETKFSQVKPLKRGGGRRYYRPGDVDVLRGIKTLLYAEGYTIRGVQKVFKTDGVRYVAEVGQAGVGLPRAMSRALAPSMAGVAPAEPATVEEIAAPAPAPAAVTSRMAPAGAQLSLVEPRPLKLATVERRKLQSHLDLLVRLHGALGGALGARAQRLAVDAPAPPVPAPEQARLLV